MKSYRIFSAQTTRSHPHYQAYNRGSTGRTPKEELKLSYYSVTEGAD